MVKTEQLVNKGWAIKKMFPCKVLKGNPERVRWANLELLRSQSEHFGCTSSYPIGEADQ